MLSKLALFLISAYKLCLSPFIGNQCRFYPTCSTYTREAIIKHGCLKGCILGAGRICRCHPFHPGGCDPVPEQFSLIKNP